jgi:hypothetical protein
MHVSFKIHYRNNLINKKGSYLISCPPSWDDRNYSYGHQLYPTTGPKIKSYLFGIATLLTEKLAAQIILFAFQTICLLLKKSVLRRNFDRVCGVCSGLYLFQILIVKALYVHYIESKRLNNIE